MTSQEIEPAGAEARASAAPGIATAATVVALGNVTSRVFGLLREMVIADLFGATGLVSAFDVAARVPRMLYDLLIDGLVSSALVPVFSELAERDRVELWRVAGIMLSLATLLMSAGVLVVELFAPQIARLMSGGFDADLLEVTARLMRITAPAMVFLSLAGITTGLLFALKRFTWPAFTSAAFNASIVVAALVLTGRFGWGIESLAWGLLVGSAMQVALQLPGLRDARLHVSLNWRHPVLRRIMRLYTPVVLGLVVSQVAIVVDRNLASRTGPQSIAWMRFATTLVQFPLGLVSVAIAIAILPTLSRQASSPDTSRDEFLNTLATGLSMVLVLILPAVVGLFFLSGPVVALVFEHGDFTPFDTQQTARALRFYLLGTTFAAIDLPLVYAFYARKNTLTPALVGVLGVGLYLVAALVPALFRELRMTDLVLANSVQLTGHALVMLWLINHRVGSLHGRGLRRTAVKALAASLVAGSLAFATAYWLVTRFPGQTLLNEVIVVGGAALVGLAVYGWLVTVLRIEEVGVILALLRRRLRSRSGNTT